MTSRRRFLQALAALGALPSVRVWGEPRFSGDPFTLGVASGYPSPSSVVLWTRLAPDPRRADGGLEPLSLPVRWELAADEGMRSVLASGTVAADPQWAHSVRVEVQALEPARWYWYRFTAGEAQSTIGRTRTAPDIGAEPARLRFAFASCQQYEQGWYGAYRHMMMDEPDLVAFLGDYIYESTWGRDHVRSHGAPEPYSLADYRVRHALYKTDAYLQAAHAACPWIVTWDDHEVDNDYADDRPEDGMQREAFLERRAAAYQAYYEHMPLPERMRPEGPRMRIYTQLGWGQLARFFMLDDRQYRSWHACPRPNRRGGSNTLDVEHCPHLPVATRTLLGRTQERWLERALAESRATWNVLGQQTMMARFDQKRGPGRAAWTDGWDGYPAARNRLLRFLAESRVSNPLVIGGDVHSFNVCELKRDFDDPDSEVIASEFVGTSITSQAWSMERLQALLPDNPHILFADSRYRGYVRVEVTGAQVRADLRAMASVREREAPCSTLASFIVENGRPGPKRVG